MNTWPRPRRSRRLAALAALAALPGLGCASDPTPRAPACESPVCAAFARIDAERPAPLTLRAPRGAPLPPGHDGSRYHLQGIQALGDGWLVTGSAPGAGYAARAGANGGITGVYALDGRLDHPGGFQLQGALLAVGLERTGERRGGSEIRLLDFASASAPAELLHLRVRRPVETAGAVGLLRKGDRWWLLAGNWDSECLDLYEAPASLRGPASRFAAVARWCAEAPGLEPGGVDRRWRSYQSLNLFADASGRVFALGTAGGPFGGNRADLFELRREGASLRLRKVATRPFSAPGCDASFSLAAGAELARRGGGMRVFACGRSVDARRGACCRVWR